MSLVTLQQAKNHLRITTPDGDPGDADLTMKLAHAEAYILDYCGSTAYWRDLIATWDDTTVPMPVIAAILLALGELDRYRGDDTDSPARAMPERTGLSPDSDVSPAIAGLLRRTRDPVIG